MLSSEAIKLLPEELQQNLAEMDQFADHVRQLFPLQSEEPKSLSQSGVVYKIPSVAPKAQKPAVKLSVIDAEARDEDGKLLSVSSDFSNMNEANYREYQEVLIRQVNYRLQAVVSSPKPKK